MADLTLPTVGGDANVWGGILNTALGTLNTEKVEKGEAGFSVADYFPNSTPTAAQQTTALHAALAAATVVHGQVIIPSTGLTVVGTVALSGYSCSIVGYGTWQNDSLTVLGSVIRCQSQTGPVLDFTAFDWPKNYQAKLRFQDFAVIGDGTSGTTKKGIYIPTQADPCIGTQWRNLVIDLTGGIGFDAVDMYLSEVENVVIATPTGCTANNVPYMQLATCNGTRFSRIGFRSKSETANSDVPASGVLRLIQAATQFHRAKFDSLWFENHHVPTNGALIAAQTNTCTFEDIELFDVFKESGATVTSIIHFQSPASNNFGGNIVRGVIEGHGTDALTVDHGVRLTQSHNHVTGTKGYIGGNVLLDSGCGGSFVLLGGAEANSNLPGFTDNSGLTTNTLIDAHYGSILWGAQTGQATFKVGAQHAIERVTAFTMSASQTLPYTNSSTWMVTLAADVSVASFGTGMATGSIITVTLIQDATGSRLMSFWPTTVKWSTAGVPTLSTAAGKGDVFRFQYDGTSWREVSRSMGT